MALTSIDVTWVKSVVVIDGQTKFRLQTTCSNPINITDAALFLFQYLNNQSVYLHPCTVGDMKTFYNPNGFPPIRRLLCKSAPTAYTPAVPSDVGKTVRGATSGDTGKLVSYDNGLRLWIIAPDTPADIFTPTEVVSVQTGTGSGTLDTRADDDKYRSATVTQDFSSPQGADEEKTNQETRLGYLIADWAAGYGSWAGTTTETISEP